MKSFLVYIAISYSCLFWAQSDSIAITIEDICPDVFQKYQLDSTYSDFYVDTNQDTTYFNKRSCVILPQLTIPGTTIWMTKDGLAHGNYTYFYDNFHGKRKLSGEFSEGYFISGTETQYYRNGQPKHKGRYQNGVRAGIWRFYTKEGKLEFKCEFSNGICAELDE